MAHVKLKISAVIRTFSKKWVRENYPESGDAGAGGHTWASIYLEVPRTLNEIGSFATVTMEGTIEVAPAAAPLSYCKIFRTKNDRTGALRGDRFLNINFVLRLCTDAGRRHWRQTTGQPSKQP